MPTKEVNVLHLSLVMVRAGWNGTYARYIPQEEGELKRLEFPPGQPVALSPAELADAGVQNALAKGILQHVEIDQQTGRPRRVATIAANEAESEKPPATKRPAAKRAPKKPPAKK